MGDFVNFESKLLLRKDHHCRFLMLALMCFLWLLSISEAITRYGFRAAPANLSTCSPSATRKSILKIILLILALKNEKEKIRDLDQKLAQSKENMEG